jgi:hypothetical protein
MRLAEATGISFYYHSPRRLAGDLKWKAELENILKEQVIGDVIPLWTRILNIWRFHYNTLVQLWINIAKRCEI